MQRAKAAASCEIRPSRTTTLRAIPSGASERICAAEAAVGASPSERTDAINSVSRNGFPPLA